MSEKDNKTIPEMPIKQQYRHAKPEGNKTIQSIKPKEDSVSIPVLGQHKSETPIMQEEVSFQDAFKELEAIQKEHPVAPKPQEAQPVNIASKEVKPQPTVAKQTQTSQAQGNVQKTKAQPKVAQPHPKQHSSHKKPSSDSFGKNTWWINILLVALALIVNFLILFVFFRTTQFANLSKRGFILLNLFAMLLLLAINLVIFFAIRNNKKVLYSVACGLLAIALLFGGIGSYVAGRVTTEVEKITSTVVQESVSTSFVVYNSGTSSIKDIIELEGKRVGYASGTHTATLGQEQIKNKGLNVSAEEYQDYSAVLLALFSGEIDCAILPTNYLTMFQNEARMKEHLEKTSSILDFEETVTVESAAGADKDITKEPFTVLLIGNADGLSDTMILCSVNPISMKVTMSSLARDSYVPITCYGGGQSKLNASHAVSKDCTVSTIEQLVGVDIDYYIDTNFQGVVDVVDALGGIVVNSPISFVGQSSSKERGHYTVYVPAGDNVVLNGEQALAFARERYKFADGDFARQRHQQQVIEAIMRKIMRTRDVNTFVNVMKAAGDNIQTNLSVQQMTSFVSYAMQKSNRYYDKEHIERIFDIQTSRVTGYNSGLWDAGLEMAIYIYRLWQGSLTATKTAIERNINYSSTPTAATDRIQWSANWEFTPPVISYDFYPEYMIPSEVPPEVEEKEAQEAG